MKKHKYICEDHVRNYLIIRECKYVAQKRVQLLYLLNRRYLNLYREISFDEKNKIKKECCNYRSFERYRIIAHRLVGVLCDDV